MMGVERWMVGRRIKMRKMDLECNENVKRKDYKKFLGEKVMLEKKEKRIVF